MKKIEEVLANVKGLTPEEQAKAIAGFYANKKRKNDIENDRRNIRNKCFDGCKKLTKSQQEAILYEFLASNHEYVNNRWLRKKHPELFSDDK